MYLFNRKLNITVRFRIYHASVTCSSYTIEKKGFPYAISNTKLLPDYIYPGSKWIVINKYSGLPLSDNFFNSKKDAEKWFNIFSKYIDLRDVDLFNPLSKGSVEINKALKLADSEFSNRLYRKINFGD